MAENKNSGYKKFKKDLSEGNIGNLYIFYGEEKYLQEYYISRLRKALLPEGLWEFNQKSFSASGFDINLFEEALDALPVMSERTLVEIHDYNIFKAAEGVRERFLKLIEDIPEYACLIMVFDTAEFAVDKRIKYNTKISKLFEIVEFEIQEQTDLISGIKRRYKALGKEIDNQTAEYLTFVTGGLMNKIISEIEKTAAYTKGKTITRESIDAVTVPVLEAAAYKLTDALLQRKFNSAADVLNTLLEMQETPHKILYSISLKYRQLMISKACLDDGKKTRDLMELCGIRHEFQARGLMQSASKRSMKQCCGYVKICSDAAFRLNNGEDGKTVLSELLVNIAYNAGNEN